MTNMRYADRLTGHTSLLDVLITKSWSECFARHKDVFESWCAIVRCTVAHWAMECEGWSVVATGGGVELGKARGATMPGGNLVWGAHARSRRSTKSDHSPPLLLLANYLQ